MKYAVIAALFATTSAAPTGCKPGLGVKVYSDSSCKTDPLEEHALVETETEKTGKCEDFKASKTSVEAVVHIKKSLKKKEEAADAAKTAFEQSSSLNVSTPGHSTPGKASDVYKKEYPAIREAFFAKEKSGKVI